MKCDSEKLREMLNYLNENGLDGVPFWLPMQLSTADEKNLDVRFWKILAYIFGTRTIERDYKRANELLAAKDTPKEPRFYFLGGLLYLFGKPNALNNALVCLTRACTSPTKESWYYLGACQYKVAEEHKVPDDYKYSSDNTKKSALTYYLTLLTSAYASFYNAYQMGAQEALLGMAKCSLASEKFRYSPAMNAVVQQAIDQEIIFDFQCAERAAQMGYAEGWQVILARTSITKPNVNTIKNRVLPAFDTQTSVTLDSIISAWSIEHNISLSYYLSQRFPQEDALVHYIAGVAHECGIYNKMSNGKMAKKEFEAAVHAKSDSCGFIKELANEHLVHVCSLEGYETNFTDWSSSRKIPNELLLFLQYSAECATEIANRSFPERDRKKREFIWWYKLRYAAELSAECNTEKGRLLIEARSPNAIYMMANLSKSLYINPLKTISNAKWQNYVRWLKLATETGSGSPEAEYLLAHALAFEKCQDSEHRYLGQDNWYRKYDKKYDDEIVVHLKNATLCGHRQAEFELIKAARYGCVESCVMKPEDIANGFKSLMYEGIEEARYEYAFCQYYGLTSQKEDSFSHDLYAAACADYGCARTIYEKLHGFTYWDDIDRGCQEI